MTIGRIELATEKAPPPNIPITVVENRTVVRVPITVAAKTELPPPHSDAIQKTPLELYVCAPNLSGKCLYNHGQNSPGKFSIDAGASTYSSKLDFLLPANSGDATFYLCRDTGAPYNCKQKLAEAIVYQPVSGAYSIQFTSVQATELRSSPGTDTLSGLIVLAPGGSLVSARGLFARPLETESDGKNSQVVNYKGSAQPVRFTGGDGIDSGGNGEIDPRNSYPIATVAVFNYGASYSSTDKAKLDAEIANQLNQFYHQGDSPDALIKLLNPLAWHGCDGPVAVDTRHLPTPSLVRSTDFQPIVETVSSQAITPVGGGCHTSRYTLTWTLSRTSNGANPDDANN